jgi:Tfp pilus assembly protein PilF
MGNRKSALIVVVALALIVAGVSMARAKPYPDLPDTPAYTSRYGVIDDLVALQNRIDALERDNAALREELREARDQAGALVLLRAHDISQRDTMVADAWQAWQAARVEDQKRITSLEWNVNRIWEMCR